MIFEINNITGREPLVDYFQYPQPAHCESENLLGLPIYKGAGETILKLPEAITLYPQAATEFGVM